MTQNNKRRDWIDENVFGEGLEPTKIKEEELLELSYHEGGHFVSNEELLGDCREMWCITTIRTKKFVGANMFIKDKVKLKSKQDYENEISVMLSGKIASEQMGFEPKFYQKDMLEAYEAATRLVERYYPEKMDNKEEIVIQIINRASEVARKTLKENQDKLELIAKALFTRRILTGKEAKALYNGTLTLEELEPLELN